MGAPEPTAGRSRIFISYRHEVDGYAVGRLTEDLGKHFPRDQVFQDIASIAPGADFVDALQRGLDTCAALLVVIGPNWLTLTDRQGRRRIDLRDDWVRNEVVEGLRNPGVRVFPLLLDAEMPSAEDLPEPMRPLTRRQAFPLTARHWANDVTELIEFLKKVPGLGVIPAFDANTPPAKPASERARPHAKSAAIDHSPGGTALQPQPTPNDKSALAGSPPIAAEVEKRPEGVKVPPQTPNEPMGTAGQPLQAKVPWKTIAIVAFGGLAIALAVVFSREHRPEPSYGSTPQIGSLPRPSATAQSQQTLGPETKPAQKEPETGPKASEPKPEQTKLALPSTEFAKLVTLVNAIRGWEKIELIVVTGHAAGPEAQPSTQWRSESYANSVRDSLVVLGVSRYNIEAMGMGSTQPIVGASTPNDAVNNRVEIAVKGLRRDGDNLVKVTLAETVFLMPSL